MAVSKADLAAALDLFADLPGEITHRAMMGGQILYADGQIFGAVMGEAGIHIRAKGRLAARLAAAGATQFVWTRPSDGRAMPMGYWSLPEAALDAPEEACDWARAALEAGDE
ncbi:MAG: TfoX/Sxy family protein [Pseudomonadota bacterium]